MTNSTNTGNVNSLGTLEELVVRDPLVLTAAIAEAST